MFRSIFNLGYSFSWQSTYKKNIEQGSFFFFFVIFYFETRRADSVKESLQLVDKEMQTRRIVKTIQEASEQICSTIRDGFVTLNNNITNCFTALSNQLASQHSRNLALLQGLTTSVNLNNALQAKANKTSEQLMDDVKHIRNYVFN